ncbi:DUF305 domain-containing protein [Arthrobacter sp. CAU 1506]|uniref:DUF305 domain-containing protein n=1 Tax=Arthrobacter sp. CAU 1506 TaxID=2560052 RepID=UPI0010ACCDF0|nr:DUF305 domain-containing protein [Arthrobacter sp. CAU 1506]TJY70486.1 DUF305 domain-containing protein [Arthrobacter sp. CAU 1506]
MKRHLTLSAAALATVLALAGCATSENGTEAAAQTPAATSTTIAADAEHNVEDTMFAQMMIPHHQQAVQMSEIMLSKENLDARITDLATKIKEAQGPEIEKMNGFLQAWGEPGGTGAMEGHDTGSTESTMPGHDMSSMDGMMSEEDLAKLEAAEGAEAAKLFLTQMIAHHEGAVKMAEQEAAQGSNPQAVELARAIVADQEGEIKQMQDLLKTL